MTTSKRIYLSPPDMSGLEKDYVAEAFASNWITTLGPQVDAFEKEMCEYLNIKSGCALSSGTSAIHMGIKLMDVRPGDFVFCSSLTFAASTNPILYEQGVPVFIDSEPESWNMSPKALERAFESFKKRGKLPKAMVLVNLYGQSADMDPLLQICNQYKVPVLEDAAESLGATYKNKKSGTFGNFSALSFNGNKIITTSGGGMLVSNDTAAIEKARFWSTQSRDSARHYQHSELGYNYRLSNILAAVGRGQLKVLDDRVNKRRAVFERYRESFTGMAGVEWMPEASFGRSTRWMISLTIDPKTGVSPLNILDALESINAESRRTWKPMHRQPIFEKYEYFSHAENFSVSDQIFERGVILPSGSDLKIDEQQRVIEAFKKTFSK